MTLYTITRGRNKREICRTTSLSEARTIAYDLLSEIIANKKKYYSSQTYFTSAREEVRTINGKTQVVIYASYFKHGNQMPVTHRVTINCEPIVKRFDNGTYRTLCDLIDNKLKSGN